MIECPGCQTFNPEGEPACLACGATLPRTPAAAAIASGATRCPNGHPIDPSWKSCPYCGRTQAGEGQRIEDATRPLATRLEPPEATGSAGRRTRLEGEAAGPEPAPRGPAPTRLEPPERAAGTAPCCSRTVPDRRARRAARAPLRRRAWKLRRRRAAASSSAFWPPPALGRAALSSRCARARIWIGTDRFCDVVVTGDSQVSHEHAVLIYRSGTFQLADRLSTNGTWVNGEEVPANGAVALRDRDRIRIGTTDLQFFAIALSTDREA